jgi:hypothetical protein
MDMEGMHAMPLKSIWIIFKKQKEKKLLSSIGNGFGLGMFLSFVGLIRDLIRYVAYGMTGNFDDALKQLFKQQKELTPQDEFIQLIKKKAPLAKKVHGTRRLGPHRKLINEMFASGDAETLCDELANSDMIVKGDPAKSKLLTHVVSFQGAMYQVFHFILSQNNFTFTSIDLRC